VKARGDTICLGGLLVQSGSRYQHERGCEAVGQSISPTRSEAERGGNNEKEHLACKAGDRRHYLCGRSLPPATQAPSSSCTFPTLRFAAREASILPICFAASFMVTPLDIDVNSKLCALNFGISIRNRPQHQLRRSTNHTKLNEHCLRLLLVQRSATSPGFRRRQSLAPRRGPVREFPSQSSPDRRR